MLTATQVQNSLKALIIANTLGAFSFNDPERDHSCPKNSDI
jgi:hypothetical protein